VNQEDSEQNEVDGMKKGADSAPDCACFNWMHTAQYNNVLYDKLVQNFTAAVARANHNQILLKAA